MITTPRRSVSPVAKTDPEAIKRERRKTIRWVVTIFLITIVISGTISLGNIGGLVAFGLLLVTIVLFCAKGAKSVKE